MRTPLPPLPIHIPFFSWLTPPRGRRDCANGFLVAEALSRYFPSDFSMYSYSNGTSTATRKDNWEQIQRACRRRGFVLPQDVVTACMEERCGAAVALLEQLYEHLTQKQIRRPEEVLPSQLLAVLLATQFGSSQGGGSCAWDVAAAGGSVPQS